MAEDTIAVPLEYYRRLLDDSQFLEVLHRNGVDNWDYYGDSVEEHEADMKNKKELI